MTVVHSKKDSEEGGMMRRLQWSLFFLILGGALLFGTAVIPGFGADGLFSDAGDAQVAALQTGRATPDPTVVRTRYVRITSTS